MAYLLFLGLVAGELFKLPVLDFGGITLLDLSLFVFCAFCLFKHPHFKNPPFWIKTGLFFILTTIISQLFSPLSLTMTERLVGVSYIFRFFIYLLASYLIYLNFFQLKKNTPKLLLFAGITLSVLGILQFIFIPDLQFLASAGWDPHFYRTVTTFLDPNFAGAFFGLTLIILFLNQNTSQLAAGMNGSQKNFPKGIFHSLLWNSSYLQNPFSKKIFRIIFSVIFIALLTTFSRGSYLLFATSFISISILTKSLKTFITTLILISILVIGFLTYEPLIAIPKNVDRTESASQRFDTWQQGLTIFEKNPVLGVGFNNYRFALKQHNLANSEQIESHGGSTNDSSLLFVLATTGMIGIAVYLFSIFSIFKHAFQNWKQKNIWGLIILTGLTGLIAQSFFANTLFFPPLLAWMMFSLSQLSDNNSR